MNFKTAAANEQFGASGGADSSDTEQVTSSFVLVRALPMPPPAAKPPPRCVQAVQLSSIQDSENLDIKCKFKIDFLII